jgi:hypothetical protein
MNAINGAVSVWGGGMFHATVMHAGRYQEMPASSGYKSQRRNRTKGERGNQRGMTEERKKRQRERGKTEEETTSKRQTQGRK